MPVFSLAQQHRMVSDIRLVSLHAGCTNATATQPRNETLYDQFQQLMDTQFQIGELKRQMLTMPALPNEGF